MNSSPINFLNPQHSFAFGSLVHSGSNYNEINKYLPELTQTILKFLSFDPNYDYSDENKDNNNMDEDDNSSDDDDSDDDYDDSDEDEYEEFGMEDDFDGGGDDTSWKGF